MALAVIGLCHSYTSCGSSSLARLLSFNLIARERIECERGPETEEEQSSAAEQLSETTRFVIEVTKKSERNSKLHSRKLKKVPKLRRRKLLHCFHWQVIPTWMEDRPHWKEEENIGSEHTVYFYLSCIFSGDK